MNTFEYDILNYVIESEIDIEIENLKNETSTIAIEGIVSKISILMAKKIKAASEKNSEKIKSQRAIVDKKHKQKNYIISKANSNILEISLYKDKLLDFIIDNKTEKYIDTIHSNIDDIEYIEYESKRKVMPEFKAIEKNFKAQTKIFTNEIENIKNMTSDKMVKFDKIKYQKAYEKISEYQRSLEHSLEQIREMYYVIDEWIYSTISDEWDISEVNNDFWDKEINFIRNAINENIKFIENEIQSFNQLILVFNSI